MSEIIPFNEDPLSMLIWTVEFPEKVVSQSVEIYYFSLTTCVYCKKGIAWLLERHIGFKWLYLDQLNTEKKNDIKTWIQQHYQLSTRMASPFVIFRFRKNGNVTDFISNGFDPEYWNAKIPKTNMGK